MVFIIIGGEMSLWIRPYSDYLNTKTFSLLISTSFKSTRSAGYSSPILSSFIRSGVSRDCLGMSENLGSIYC
jgi:hypothetical protein